ncbi:SLATT domain-containing protein [Vibrio fluvialis]|uniref:SLATT domain-containing protein n=1 Tax=Vibrio fluvialis TaxID=676 RepID=UPI001EEA74F9|nr:SLATT domain-containing protein [Vibrio fluvialis]MCG6409021.1 SLATT domain-containing protein [Vibrio fluvialis]
MSAKISDNIWFTRLARIEASRRLLSAETHSQALLVSYSLMSVSLSIIFLVQKSTNFDNVILCLLSTIILVLSLVVSNGNYKGRSIEMKQNYIDLQLLYYKALKSEEEEDKDALNEIGLEYNRLLSQTENHKTVDDIRARKDRNTSRPVTEKEEEILTTDNFIKLAKIILWWLPFLIGVLYGINTIFKL